MRIIRFLKIPKAADSFYNRSDIEIHQPVKSLQLRLGMRVTSLHGKDQQKRYPWAKVFERSGIPLTERIRKTFDWLSNFNIMVYQHFEQKHCLPKPAIFGFAKVLGVSLAKWNCHLISLNEIALFCTHYAIIFIKKHVYILYHLYTSSYFHEKLKQLPAFQYEVRLGLEF